MEIVNAKEFFKLIEGETNCVLIWDVRGDAPRNTERDKMILIEIAILNEIVNHVQLRSVFLLHVKINMKHMTSYSLPTDGGFYVQPYTLYRDVYEARYVVHLRSAASVNVFNPSDQVRDSMLREMDRARAELETGALGEHELVANVLTARYRRIDYLYE